VRRDDQLTESLGGIERSLGIDAGLNKIALDLPAAVVKLLAAKAAETSNGVTPRAAIRSGLSQTRIAKSGRRGSRHWRRHQSFAVSAEPRGSDNP